MDRWNDQYNSHPILKFYNSDEYRGNDKVGVVVHACNPSTQKAEAGGSQVQDQVPG
jgi:hypothetical protein